jgi:non-ribosomal peptide synthetase component F
MAEENVTTRRMRSLHSAGLRWLEDGQRPLDCNGPTGRVFTTFRDEDLSRPIIEHFERVARRYPERIAVTDGATSLCYAELWGGVSGLAASIAAETRPGDLIAIVLRPCSMLPLAMLACLAAGRAFVALDPHHPDDWVDQVLEDARPALIIGSGVGLRGLGSLASKPPIIYLTRMPRAAQKDWRPAELGVGERRPSSGSDRRRYHAVE